MKFQKKKKKKKALQVIWWQLQFENNRFHELLMFKVLSPTQSSLKRKKDIIHVIFI